MAPPTTNGRYSDDPDRNYMLRCLRGEIATNDAYQTIAAARELLREGRLDQESIAALNIGDTTHLDDPLRWTTMDRTWEQAVDADPATEAAFDQLTQREDFASRYQPTDNDELWDTYDHEPLQVFIDWPGFWADDDPDDEWLYDQVFARGRGHAVYASHKQGKSLFVLWCAAQIATTRTDVDVIYLDYEMTRADVRERLQDMGYGPDTDLTRLYYALLPSIPPLDTLEGMNALMELVRQVERPDAHQFVVIDTTARAAHGDENSADTYRDFYRWTGTALKRRGITWVRLDHAGKDPLKGQRGSSSKGDDVDVVWRLQQADNGVVLHRDVARMSWVPEKIEFAMSTDPLTYTPGAETWPPGTAELARQLADLQVPVDATYKQACDAGVQGRKQNVLKALKFRRQTAPLTLVDNPVDNSGTVSGTAPATNNGNQNGNQPVTPPLTSGNRDGNRREPEAAGVWEPFPPPRGEPVHPGTQPATRTCRCGQAARDISGLCPACIANPGTLPAINPADRF